MRKMFDVEFDPAASDASTLICQVHERNLMEAVSGRGDPQSLFLDVGAHVGLWSLTFSDEYVGVVAVEPNPTAYASLTSHAGRYGNGKVIPVNHAAWNKNETLTMTLYSIEGNSTVRPEGHPFDTAGEKKGETQVQAVRLDDLVPKDSPRIGFVKIDTEGAEVEVIEGMLELLRRDRPMILIELHKPDSAARIRALLPDRGFSILTYGVQDHLFSPDAGKQPPPA